MLSLPNLGSVTVGTAFGNRVQVQALAGGTISLPSLTQLSTGPVQFESDGTGSVLTLSALGSYVGVADGASPSLQVSNGGTVQAAALITLNDVDLTLIGGTVSLPSLTNTDASNIKVSGGGTLTLAGIASYSAPNGSTLLEATGTNSVLSLPNLGSVTVGTAFGNRVQVQALAGGTISLPSLTQLNTGPVQFESDGTGSVLTLSALGSFAGVDDGASPSLQVSNGGSVQAAALTTLNGVTLTLIGGTVSLPSLTNVDASNIEVSGGGTLTLPGITADRVTSGTATLEATGAGSSLSLPNLGNVTVGTAFDNRIQVQALAGGTLSLPGLSQVSTGPIQFESDGAGSMLNIAALVSLTGTNNGASPSLQVTNGGIVQVTSGALALNGYAVTLTSPLTVGTLNLGANSTLTGTGTVTGNLINGGTVIPGNSTGQLTITGNYTQLAAGALDFTLDGPQANTQYSQLAINGSATFGGALKVSFGSGYTPTKGTNFQVMSFTSATGSFATTNGLHVSSTLELDPSTTATTLTLTADPIVSFTNPLGGSWNTPSNWSTGQIPTSGDNVVIGYSGVTVTESLGDVTIASIQSLAALDITTGSFQVTAGASAINAALTVGSGASLTATGIGTSFAASGSTTVSGASLYADAGATLSLPKLISYVSDNNTFQADGTGSVLDVSALTNVTQQGSWDINATNGGTLSLSGLSSLNCTNIIDIQDTGGGTLNLGGLTSLTSTVSSGLGISITDTGGSTLLDGKLTSLTAEQLAGINVTIDGTDAHVADSWKSFTDSSLNVYGGLYSLPNLTDVDGASLFVNAGTLSLPDLTSCNANFSTFQASGAGSVLDLSALTTVTEQFYLVFNATNGGELNLSGLTSLTRGPNSNDIVITDTGSSTILDGNLTSLNGVDVTLDGTDPHVADSWTTYAGSFTLTGGSDTLPKLTTANFYALQLSGVATLNLSATTANDTNSGNIAIGAGSTLNVAGNFTFPPGNTLKEELGGTLASGLYGRVNIGGSVALAGSDFNLDLINGYTPIDGQDYPALTYASASGSFATITGLPAGMTASQGTTEFELATPPAPIVTWINPNGGNWDDAANWSNDSVPTSGDDVIINTTSPATITIQAGDNIRIEGIITGSNDTLSIMGGSLMVTAGISTLSGPLSMTGGSLSATGSGVSLTANGSTIVDGANLVASGGATLSLPALTSYSNPTISSATLQASGSGSVLSLPALTTLNADFYYGTTLSVEALSGGQVLLPTACHWQQQSQAGLSFKTDGAGSELDVSNMTAFYGNGAGLQLSNGGTILDGNLATLTNVTVTVIGGSYTFGSLTNLDISNVEVSSGGEVTLPLLISYNNPTGTVTKLQASGSGSVLSLPALTTLNAAFYYGTTLSVKALSGGQVLLPELTTIGSSSVGAGVAVETDSAGSELDVSNMTAFYGNGAGLQLSNGGTILDGNLATLTNVTVTVIGGSYTFGSLTNLDISNVEVSSGGKVTLPLLISYNNPTGTVTKLQASGSGSVLSLPALTTLNAAFNYGTTLSVEALGGGQVLLPDLPAIGSSTVGAGVFVETDGTGSELDVSSLTAYYGNGATLQLSHGGTILDGNLATLTNVTVKVIGGSYTFGSLTDIDNSSLYVSGGATVSLPDLTSYNYTGSSARPPWKPAAAAARSTCRADLVGHGWASLHKRDRHRSDPGRPGLIADVGVGLAGQQQRLVDCHRQRQPDRCGQLDAVQCFWR